MTGKMMTYHALDIPEILSLIFEASDEAVLGQLAQCCKTFSNPALDVLWRMLPTPEPLRRLLPVKFDKYGGLPADVFIRDDQCERFAEYSKRVHHIQWDSNPGVGLPGWNSSFFFQVAHLLPGSLSFPKLQQLELHECGPCDVSLNIIISPSLRRLTWIRDDALAPARSPLQVAVCQAPLLQHLQIIGGIPWMHTAYISRFKHLTSLDLSTFYIIADPLTTRQMYHNMINDLSHMRLVIIRLPSTLRCDHIPPGVTFSHLKSLYSSNSPATIGAFLDTLSVGRLRTFHSYRSPSFAEFSRSWSMCLDNLRLHCGSSLRKLYLVARTIDDGLSMMDTIRPLLDIHTLEDVTLSLFPTASSDEVQTMASAWPHLTSFMLGMYPLRTTFPLQGLVHLGRSCPGLITLKVEIVEGLLSLPDLEMLPTLSHGLQSLILDVPADTNHVFLARVLDRLFPTLENLSVNSATALPPLWDDVLQMLKAFRTIRQECRSVSVRNNVGEGAGVLGTQTKGTGID